MYIDLVFLLNLFIDFLILMTLSITLKRNIKVLDLLKGALVGSSSIFLLFIKLNNLELFLLKFIISIIMLLVSFKFKNMKYFTINFIFLYIISIFLGGFLYFINDGLTYQNQGLVFKSNKYSLNIIVLLISVPIILYLYIKQHKINKNYNNYYIVDITYNNIKKTYKGYLDTGNTLKDYITNKPVIFVCDKKPNMASRFIPYKTIKEKGVIEVYKGFIEIKDLNLKKDVLISFIDDIKIDNANCILNREII